MTNIDAFKCFCCGQFFDGTQLGGTTVYPYKGSHEYYCKTCKGPAVTPPPKIKPVFTFRSGIRIVRIRAVNLNAARLALAIDIPDAWVDPAWNWTVEEST